MYTNHSEKDIKRAFDPATTQIIEWNKLIIEMAGACRFDNSSLMSVKMMFNAKLGKVVGHPASKKHARDPLLRRFVETKIIPTYAEMLSGTPAQQQQQNQQQNQQQGVENDSFFSQVATCYRCYNHVALLIRQVFYACSPELVDKIVMETFRTQFFAAIQARVSNIFFQKLSALRRQNDSNTFRMSDELRELRTISEIFYGSAKAMAAGDARWDATSSAAYRAEFLDRYLNVMQDDNRRTVATKLTSGLRANEVAQWLTQRRKWEKDLVNELVGAQELHDYAMRCFDENVLAHCVVELVNNRDSGFEANLLHACMIASSSAGGGGGDATTGSSAIDTSSFAGAIDLFEISFHIQHKHPQCVNECVRAFRDGVAARLRRVLQETEAVVFQKIDQQCRTLVHCIAAEEHMFNTVMGQMQNHPDLQRACTDSFKAVLNAQEPHIVRKIAKPQQQQQQQQQAGAPAHMEKRVYFAEVLAGFVDDLLKSDESSTTTTTSTATSTAGGGAAASSAGDDGCGGGGDGGARGGGGGAGTRSGGGGPTRDPMREIGLMFSLIRDKDMFQMHYSTRMSKRLLTNRYDRDREALVLEQLTNVSGQKFTYKMEGMLNDLPQSENVQRGFEQCALYRTLPSCDLKTQVLTLNNWPQARPEPRFNFPAAARQSFEIFQRYYADANRNRQLVWQPERCSAVLEVRFPRGTRLIEMNVHQAAVMIAIDEAAPTLGGAGVPMPDICERTGIAIDEIKPLLASMLFARGFNVVRRPGTGAAAAAAASASSARLENGNTFEMNIGYSINKRKIKLPHAVPIKAGGDAASQDPNDISIDEKFLAATRRDMLDAAIVATMKARQTLHAQQLFNTVEEKVGGFFRLEPRQFKERLQDLSSKDYLARDEDDPDLIKFVRPA